MHSELALLMSIVEKARPKSTAEVLLVVEDYFRPIGWSILKEEYEVFMTVNERLQFIQTLFNEVANSGNHIGRR